MKRNLIALASVALVCISSLLLASENRRSEDISLALAVEEFNISTLRQREEAGQPPLTEDEVIAAIRLWHLTDKTELPTEVRDRVREIAESRVVPPNAVLGRVAGSYEHGYHFYVYRVILNIVGPGEQPPVNVVIRDRLISSRRIRPEEQRELDRRFSARTRSQSP